MCLPCPAAVNPCYTFSGVSFHSSSQLLMSSERHQRYHGAPYPPPGLRPDHVPPQRLDRYSESQQLLRTDPRRPREHHQARAESRWGGEARTPQDAPHRHPSRYDGHGGQDQRRIDPRAHGDWREQMVYPMDEGHSRSSSRDPPQGREWEARQRQRNAREGEQRHRHEWEVEQRHRHEWEAQQRHRYQGYRRGYDAGPDPLRQSHGQGAGRAMQDGQPRTWVATDEMDRRQREGFTGHTEVPQEYPEPRREHNLGHPSYAPNHQHEAWGAQHGYPHPGAHPHYESGDPRAFQYEEGQRPASGWEGDIYAMLPSQMDMTRGKRDPRPDNVTNFLKR